MDVEALIPEDILARYEIHSFRHAAAVLHAGCKAEFDEILDALRAFEITIADIRAPGGNESEIPKRLAELLRPKGWIEARITADLHVRVLTGRAGQLDESGGGTVVNRASVRAGFIDGHKVDFYKGNVAFDVEWNSKDQTFDRDLYAFRAFHDCNLISAGILLTRSAELNEVFDQLGPELNEDGTAKMKKGKPKLLKWKYGASTTWMGKLIYRIEAGRSGSCPVLAIGITKRVIADWEDFVNEQRSRGGREGAVADRGEHEVPDRPGRPAVEVYEQDREDGAGTPAPEAL